MSKYVWLLLAAWLAGSVYMLNQWSEAKTDLELTRRELKEVQHAIVKTERKRLVLQNALQTTSQAFAEELLRSKDIAADVVDKHLADNKRLRVRLSAANTQCAGTGSGGQLTNDRAEIHRETAEALVSITTDADSTVRALQETIRHLQSKTEE